MISFFLLILVSIISIWEYMLNIAFSVKTIYFKINSVPFDDGKLMFVLLHVLLNLLNEL